MADWNERYARGEHATLEPNALLVGVSERLTPGRALDLACGAGRHALHLARLGWRVTAVDASSVGVEMTRERARELNVEVNARVADLERGEFEIEREAYDLIAVFYYLQRNLWPELRAGLRSGGTLVAAIHLADEDPSKQTGNPDFLLQPGELRAELDGWEITHYHETQLTDEDAGEHHRRTAEIVARKP
ncbi:MAG TPA: methyltransferase domain-containing protein [Pyrinomonadaceae bacterium]|nr:methyltransferase domain-containing protein [Pyrinomonadaceae bacterium]